MASLDDLMAKYAILHERILSGELPPRYVVFVSNPEYGYGNKYACSCLPYFFVFCSFLFFFFADSLAMTLPGSRCWCQPSFSLSCRSAPS